ncbi:MAG: DNA internalization-related competence protein ComEC/Rec2 [Dehalococcoidia bacterium]|nr:DNA internalization-related competence protein ComEC/Rec2 [Dehalococcoidia bacterium]MDD5493883.1 DNA internalization-related competence protein ComEC/Rec2 [Dehalococcoidia bacterium]
MPLLYLSISWLTGIFIGSIIALSPWLLAPCLAVIIPAIFLKRYRKILLLSAFCYLAVIGGTLRYQSTIQPLDNTRLQYYNGKGVCQIQGMVSDAPEIKKTSISFRFSADNMTFNDTACEVRGDVLIRLPFYKEIRYGDVLLLTGELETPPQFDDFDYKNYLAGQGIYSILNYPKTSVLQRHQGFLPFNWIYDLRDKMAQSLSISIPEPQSSLAQAILLGLRGNIPADLMQSFYYTGTTHLLAISGLNLTIILGMIVAAAVLLFGRKNKLYIWISLSLIWLYTLLTGMPATVVRAAFMGTVFLLAELAGRQRNSIAALALTAALMVGLEPRILWETSFQMSALSMLGLALVIPYFYRDYSIADNPLHSVKNLVIVGLGSTLAAVLATWPVIAVNFHQFSLVSMPATFFAMPSLPAIIFTSVLTAVAGLIWQPLGWLLGLIAWLFLSYFLLIIQIFSTLPLVFIQDINLELWQVILYYIILAAAILILQNYPRFLDLLKSSTSEAVAVLNTVRARPLKDYAVYLVPILLAANILVWVAFATLPDGKLHVSFLDVGQGESILIRTGEGRNVLIDTGPDSKAAAVQLGKCLPFWDRKIDMLILSQPQSDHTSGCLQIINTYKVKTVALSTLPSNSVFYEELDKLIEQKSIKTLSLHARQEISLGGGVKLVVLTPPVDQFKGTADDINNNSTALKLKWNSIDFLLTSDIEREAEKYLMENRIDLRSDVLKVAHHGSRNSTSDDFLAIVRPATAVISAGEQNRFGHPHQEVLDRLNERVGQNMVFLTSKCGTVEFISDGQKLWYRTDKVTSK